MKSFHHLIIYILFAICGRATAENLPAIADLMNRIDTSHTLAGKVETRLDDSLGKTEQFMICPPEKEGGSALIKGNTISALTVGLNWYLNHYVHLNLSWNQPTADMSVLTLPVIETTVQQNCNAPYRYYLNYCTFGYSMTTWSWSRWQQEIDWMALHGVNMPLQIVGLETVWRNFLMEDCGYSETDAEAFVPGPAYTAWWGMNNLEGWGGDGTDQSKGVTDNAWYVRQATLANKIITREKELGMQPVLPGYSGMVPTNFTDKTGFPTEATNKWNGFPRPYIQDPTDANFAVCAGKYYAQLEKVMGTSLYYSMDPFHEGGTIKSGAYADGYKAVYQAMNDNVGSSSKWIIQQWQWASYQKLSLTSVPAGRLVVLDLYSDGRPAFSTYNGYTPQEAIYCAIPNFGGRSGMMGRLNAVAANYFSNKSKYSTIKGVGAAPEAIEQTPVTYDLLFELPWMNSQPNVNTWLRNYTTSRYGQENNTAQGAWTILQNTVLGFGTDGLHTPVEDVWAARPNVRGYAASSWGNSLGYHGSSPATTVADIYTVDKQQQLIVAVNKFISQIGVLGNNQNFQYDLIEAEGQAMADYAYHLLHSIGEARDAGDNELARKRMDTFLQLVLDMDTFKGTNSNFRTGYWTEQARLAASEVEGATTATPDWYELNNARQLITTWGDKGQSDSGGLRDYSYRSWQGILKDLYYQRWKYYFDHDCKAPTGGWFLMEWDWAHRLKWNASHTAKSTVALKEGEAGYAYSPQAEGNTCDEAIRLFNTYLLPVSLKSSTYYAYRSMTSDLRSSITLSLDRSVADTLRLPVNAELIQDQDATVSIDLNGNGTFEDSESFPFRDGMTVGPSNGGAISTKAQLQLHDGTQILFTVKLTKNITMPRRVSVRSSNKKLGTVRISGVSASYIENTETVTCRATAKSGYVFRGWYTEAGNLVSTAASYSYTGAEPLSLVAYFDAKPLTYPAVTENFKDKSTIQSYGQFVKTMSVSIGGAAATQIYSTDAMPTTLQQCTDKVIAKSGSSLKFTWTGSDGLKYLYVTAWVDSDGDGTFDTTSAGTVGTVKAQDTGVITGSITIKMPALKAGKFTIVRLRFDSAWNIATSATAEATRFYYDVPIGIGTSMKMYKGTSVSSTLNVYDTPVMNENYLGIINGTDIPVTLSGAANIVCNGVAEQLYLTDEKNFYAPSDFKANEVVYNRLNNNEWSTVILPFAPWLDEETTLYSLKDANLKEGTITFMPQTAPVANMPYLMHSGNNSYDLILSDVEVQATSKATADEITNNSGKWTLKGSYRQSNVTATSTQHLYVVNQSNYEPVKKNIDLQPFRAYLSLTPSTATEDNTLAIVTSENEDAIPTIQHNDDGTVDLRYNLDGTLLTHPSAKGITIRKGRKSLRH